MSNNITIPKGEKVFFRKKLFNWHKKNRRAYIWRDVDDPYVVLVAEVFLQKTPANRVANFLPTFIEIYPNFKSLTDAKLCELEHIMKPLGFIKRAKWLQELSHVIIESHGDKVPSEKKELLKLKGIGSYTADAILTFAYKKDSGLFDVNIKRLYSRFFGINFSNYLENETYFFVNHMVPNGCGVEYNEALLDFAAIICKVKPNCINCIIKNKCKYKC